MCDRTRLVGRFVAPTFVSDYIFYYVEKTSSAVANVVVGQKEATGKANGQR